MNTKYKKYLKLNIVSLFFTGMSFISITLAWFAYSGLSTVETLINVQAWQINFVKNNEQQSNNIVVSLSDISPGMETKSEIIDINNLGDVDALIDYEIKSARIFDEVITIDDQRRVEDVLSHNYPFHINMSLSDRHANAHDGTGEFNISVSWPLDAGQDELDSVWGKKAYEFNKREQELLASNPSYQPRSSISIEISLKAEQYIADLTSPDPNYKLGSIILFDYVKNERCTIMSDTCIKSYVIDVDNKLGDSKVTLLPDLYNTYLTSTGTDYHNQLQNQTASWTVPTRGLQVQDILPIISKDVTSSELMRPPQSSEIIGSLRYGNRINQYITSTIEQGAFYRYLNENFPFLVSTKCYWLNNSYDETSSFALTKVDDTYSKIYSEDNSSTCSVIPVAVIDKNTSLNSGEKPVKVLEGDGTLIGDRLQAGTEFFRVLSSTNETITMLAEHALDLKNNVQTEYTATSSNIEDTNVYHIVPFAGKAYFSSQSLTYATPYPYVYNLYNGSADTTHKKLIDYVQAYKNKFTSIGLKVLEARLLNGQELAEFGCEESNAACNEKYSWVHSNQTWWTGAAYNSSGRMLNISKSVLRSGYYGNEYGVRPVLIINRKEIA